ESHGGVAVVALLNKLQPCGRLERRSGRLLHHDKCLFLEPPPDKGRSKRAFAQTLAVGWVGKDDIEWLDRACLAERRRVAAKYLGAALEPHGLDIGADQTAAFGRFLDEQAMRGTARQR